MTLLIRGTKIAKYEVSDGVSQKLLLNRHETGDSRLEIKKFILDMNSNFYLELEQNSLNWLHALTPGLMIDNDSFDIQSLRVLNGGNNIVIENVGDAEAELLFCTVPNNLNDDESDSDNLPSFSRSQRSNRSKKNELTSATMGDIDDLFNLK